MTVVVISFIVCLLFFLGVGIASARQRKNTSDDYLLATAASAPGWWRSRRRYEQQRVHVRRLDWSDL